MCNLYDLDVAPPFLKDRFRLKRIPDAAAHEKSGAVRPVSMRRNFSYPIRVTI
jgi:hypothetical protein